MTENANSMISGPGRLGFGTSGIMGAAASMKGRIRLLEFAFDQGITHFDTAPLYGMGEAEKTLGMFTKTRRGKLSITTKFGLPPTHINSRLAFIKPFARYVSQRSRFAHSLVSRFQQRVLSAPSAAQIVAGTDRENQISAYTPEKIISSLEQSLVQIGTDYIDYFLYHECPVNGLGADSLEALESLVTSGKIRRYGIATNRHPSVQILDQYPDFDGVVQINDSFDARPLNDSPQLVGKMLITHGSLTAYVPRLTVLLKQHPEQLANIRALSGLDMNVDKLVPALLLQNVLLRNASGLVLFSSKSRKKIMDNTAAAGSQNQGDVKAAIEALVSLC